MHESYENSENEKTIYYDGSCPMCTVMINKVAASSKGARFDMQDITKATMPTNFTREDVEREIHVIGADGRTYTNADAMLEILSEYPAWRPFVWIGRLPLVRAILPLGYNFIAANRHFLFGPAARIYWLKVVVCIGFISGILLSLKLWVSTRFYPLTPLIDIFPPIPYPFDWIILFAVFLALVTTILVPRPRKFIWAVVALVTALAFLDQSRLQPWVYHYMFMLAALGLFSWKFDDTQGKDTTLNVCRFIVASIYFWSGLQKVNAQFFGDVYPWMVTPIAQLLPETAQPVILLLGMLIPFIEMGIGIGLLTSKLRNLAILLAVAMCTFVLWTIGPWGHNWNSVVWPWNLTMVALVFVLFIRTKNVPLFQMLWVRNYVFHKVILVVFGLLPLFYFFNFWDSYPSWSLYSGTINESVIKMSARVKNRLPPHIQSLVHEGPESEYVLVISDWSYDELNVPPYPETRIFKNIAWHICPLASDPREITLVMRGRLSWFYDEGRQVLNCSQLYNSR